MKAINVGAAVAAAAALVAVALGWTGRGPADPTAVERAGHVLEVELHDRDGAMRFEPAEIEVRRGDVIRFVQRCRDAVDDLELGQHEDRRPHARSRGRLGLLEGDRVTIFDGLEFSESLRWIDVISEVAFTAMDLAERGRPDFFDIDQIAAIRAERRRAGVHGHGIYRPEDFGRRRQNKNTSQGRRHQGGLSRIRLAADYE